MIRSWTQPLSNIGKISFLFVFLIVSRSVLGSPCCGGSAVLPSLITGDDKAQLNLILSHESVVADRFDAEPPVYRASDDSEYTQTLRLQGAYLLSERWQVGIDLPFVQRVVSDPQMEGNARGVGDLNLYGGFEVLPALSYSAWKPRGYVFARVQAPTGRSIYQAVSPIGVDALGSGTWAVALGSVLLKTWKNFDALFSLEAHWNLSREFTPDTGPQRTLGSGWGAASLLGAGWSPAGGRFRLGLAFSPTYESERSMQVGKSTASAPTAAKWIVASMAQASLKLFDEWTTSLSYSDQTLFNLSNNTSLSRGLSLLMQKRFEL